MPTQRLEENRVEERVGEGEGERERERTHTKEKEREKALWLLILYVFSSTWACPMQIGLSQECCLFYLKSTLVFRPSFVLFLRAFPFLVF